ncbi:AAA family ATPase [Bradyrhizobium sp. 4]|uniref:AAA family ATPase n=1 Tax=unclassified Bradyrhizobium TaxID=2631580 RepID=UPI001FF916AF|nr:MULTISPECIES: AAA family ATPase [unclassified Bradyrhizobium]MCK1402340.1 AAA family ATPase [Bradyrhizobium sp. 39]MCK1747935.1 AAA family ATPase [Bradyrhizobium sp. 135]UPJ32428.1 AAA family ATPase [Bradyrhizobium sp. 4]
MTSLLEIDEAERLSASLSIDAFHDLTYWWCGGKYEPEMSPPLALGWDIHRQWPNSEGFEIWRDLMHEYESPLLAEHLLGPGDPRQPVTIEQYEAALVDEWAAYDRPKHWLDQLIIDVMHYERERGYEPCGDAWERTEKILNDLAAKVGAKRAADQAERDARVERHRKRVQKFFDLDDAGYAQWQADTRPWGDGLKFERWRDRHFRELLEKTKAMPVIPFPKPAAPTNLIQSSGQFVRDFVPPDYVVDRIFQRRFCYSMTAKTGGGKTAAAMRLAAHVAIGRSIGGIEVEKGTVIYAAGENPTDVQARWLGVTQEMGIDPDAVDVHFINGVVKISENVANIETEVVAKGLKPTLIIVDTVAAYFEGDDDNDNVQMGNYARLLRSMTNLPGGPCVLALAHPTKRAADDDLIPKGGGAFLNEVDGNVALRRNGQVIAFEALGKFRGPSFEPVHFELVTVQHPKLRDTKGRPIPTVVARPVSDMGIVQRELANERDEDTLLRAIDQHPRKSRRDVGKLIGMSDSRVYRLAQKLEAQKLIRNERNGWTLTATGQRELNVMDSRGSGVNQPPLPPARFPGAN